MTLREIKFVGTKKFTLNAGKDTLIRNEKLINLRRYCEDAICAGKYGDEPLEKLKSM